MSTRYTSAKEDAEPPRFSEALFGLVRLPDQLLVGGWVRNGYLWNTVDGKLADRRFLQMRADVAAQIRIGHFRVNASVGVQADDTKAFSQQAWITANDRKANLVSREHWAGFDLAGDTVLIRAGRINVPFGLRNIEHTSWIRSETRTDINQNQQHGVAVSYNASSLRAEGMLIAGNYQLRPDAYRERGIAGYLEYALNDRNAIGASALVARAAADVNERNENVRQAHGFFARLAPWRPLVLLAEFDALVSSLDGSGTSVGYVGFVQADYEVLQGVHLGVTGETLRRARKGAEPGGGAWASVTWFFLPHFDVRADVVRRFGLGGSDTMTYLLQLQGYL